MDERDIALLNKRLNCITEHDRKVYIILQDQKIVSHCPESTLSHTKI